MRQFKTFILSLPFMLTLLGCSQEELAEIPDNGNSGKIREVEVKLTLGVNSGLRLNTRSVGNVPDNYVQTRADENLFPRELTTTDNAQQVNDMRIYVFRCPEADGESGDYLFYVPKDLKDSGIDYYDISAMGYFTNKVPYLSNTPSVFEEHTVALKPKLEEGYYYKFLAVGRDDKYAKPISSVTEIADYYLWGYKTLKYPVFKENETTFGDASLFGTVLSLEQDEDGYDYEPLWCTELFTGYMKDEKGEEDFILVNNSAKGFSREVRLQRAVAGFMLYVKNIPCLVTNDKTPSKKFEPINLTVQGPYISTAVNLVNRSEVTDEGTEPDTPPILAIIDLQSGWTKDEEQGIFVRPEDTEKGWEKNSYMSSNFIMPTSSESISKHGGDVTFRLVYIGEPERIGRPGPQHVVKIKLSDNSYLFPIEANKLYALGKKGHDENGEEINKPYPLTPDKDGGENIVITVYPDWDYVSDLEWK